MNSLSPATRGRLDRRRLLAATIVAGTSLPLAACGDVLAAPPDPRTGAPAADPDEALLDQVTEALVAQVALLHGVRAGSAPVRRRLQATLAVHQAHLSLVAPDKAPGLARRPQARKRPARPQLIAATETRLARSLAQHAVRAESGPFARVLGSMAAACAQQAELWRTAESET